MEFGLNEILSWTQGKLVNSEELEKSPEEIRISRASPLAGSSSEDVAFFFSREYESELPQASPGVLITADPFVNPMKQAKLPFWTRAAVVSCSDPYGAMALISEQIALGEKKSEKKTEIHPTAVVDPEAKIGEGVSIGPFCVVEAGASIGKGTWLQAACTIGKNSSVGENCELFSNVTVYENCTIGNEVRLHAGVVIGSDGFGYAPITDSRNVVGHRKIYHLGTVVIGDRVEIGANACVDRGTLGETRIDQNAKIDNLVQIGHNAHVEEGAIICGSTALAGRARVGAYAYIGGLTGIANNVYVGAGAKVGALALLTKDVPPGGTAVGNPQRDYKEHFRAHAALNRLTIKKRGKRNDS